ncbi:hypothetical protein TREMEDRAFT_60521 [Tremella mesenterica DSM 1558]|uniref:uncharacterized protein n=1 Tax=Tremella mesenterica (strain ATCC 24925 / CBS 8224 / DSM 1558 / NBRC 9311 / NRRL Y-6157 / RJB 2259-6 / UBC 559-6) TaxID=578456 RepID=UPI0003F490DB|nr:uncharacterized protein TREMEDRAFT_60521 [Tremella mesenterica DSM 1558]EIW71603.1 hypothetical protein TREMEDRAFT_60521 [Tremella mesenterica DSM 1558]
MARSPPPPRQSSRTTRPRQVFSPSPIPPRSRRSAAQIRGRADERRLCIPPPPTHSRSSAQATRRQREAEVSNTRLASSHPGALDSPFFGNFPGHTLLPLRPPAPVVHRTQPWARQPLLPGQLERHNLGGLTHVCPCCQALHWEAEKGGRPPPGSLTPYPHCCGFGMVDLQPFPPPPSFLHHLLTSHGSDLLPGARFREHIHTYNNAFAFTSLGVITDPISRTPGPPVLKIQGELHHWLGSLLPMPGQQSQFLQVYVSDNTAAGQMQARLARGLPYGLEYPTLEALGAMLSAVNPYVHLLTSAVIHHLLAT